MKTFRYLVVKYKPSENDKPMVNIGIIIQANDEIDCKFNNDLGKVKQIIGNDAMINELIFNNLETTFKNRFKEKGFLITDKSTGQQKLLEYTNEEYLDYLSTNLLNNYYFNNKGSIDAENISDGLVRLYKNFVDPLFNQ